MTVRGAQRVFPLAFTVLAALPGATSLASAADDVRPPTLTCVDGLLTRITPRPGERVRFRRRWLCDVDGQVNGVCTFGRRCLVCPECRIEAMPIRCRVKVPVPVGQQQPEPGVVLACLSSSTPTPCGPELSCDTATQVCVADEPVGPAIVYACEPVPAGCERDRSCRCVGASLCQPPFTACQDRGRDSITCVCRLCQ
jgi:hypothetical protein